MRAQSLVDLTVLPLPRPQDDGPQRERGRGEAAEDDALSRAVLRGMMKKRWGRIVQITSVVAATGNPGQGNYAAAKAGLIGMSKSLAIEVASRNITVNAVAPGFIQTAMTDVLNDQQKAMIAGRVPAGRIGMPQEIAAAVAYLASEEAAYVTGETIHINGGMAMI